MREGFAKLAAPNRQRHGTDPAVERLAELVDPDLLDAEEDDRVSPLRHVPRAYRPARHVAAAPRIASPGEDAERPLDQGMGEMHEQRVVARQEHAQLPEPLDEWLGAEGEPRHRPSLGAPVSRASYRVVDDFAPAREIGSEHPVEAALLVGAELWAAAHDRHRGFERGAECVVVEVDLRRKRVQQLRLARFFLRRGGDGSRIGPEGGASSRGLDPLVEIGLDGTPILAPDEAPVRGAVEDLVDRAEVFADLVRLPDHVVEKAQIGVRIADEMVHGDVTGLAVTVEPPVALLETRRVPGAVVVQQVAGGAVQVESLGRGVRGDEHPNPRSRIVECRLDVLAAGLVHALGSTGAEQGEHPVGRIALAQAPGEVVEGGLVLREHDQAFVVAELAARAQQSFDQRDEGVESGIDKGRPLRDRCTVEREPEGLERALDPFDFVAHLAGEVPEPCPDHGRGGRFALLRLAVVAGLSAYGAFGRGNLGLRRRRYLLAGEALPRAAPGIGERDGTREQPLAEDLHREGAGPPPPLRSPPRRARAPRPGKSRTRRKAGPPAGRRRWAGPWVDGECRSGAARPFAARRHPSRSPAEGSAH